MEPPRSADDGDLLRAGYRPQFLRAIGGFTAFAAGFSYLSILTGIVQNFFLGFREAGPAVVWTWPVIFAGQFLVALCLAELARQYPFCGGVYAWSCRAGAPVVGWMTGWVYLASLLVTLPAVALALNITLPVIWPGFQLLETSSANAVVLGAILIAVSTFINVAGTRWMAAIMNIGVIVELSAAVILIGLLALRIHRGLGETFVIPPAVEEDGFGAFTPFLAAAVMAAYVMYGFDTAGTLAEETRDPKRRAPRAILQALVAAAVLGMLLLLAAVLSAPDLTDAMLSGDAGGLPYLIKAVLGETLGTVFLACAVFAVFICTLAVQANTARIIFAMARDKSLPGSAWLAHVSPERKTPDRAALFVGVIGCGLLLVNMNFEKVMTALVCVSIVWANLAYLMTNMQMLRGRLAGTLDWREPFLGWWGLPVNILAVIWSAVLIVNIGWPRERLYGSEWHQQYAAPLFTALLLALGIIFARQKRITL
ncbi:APC family permease [Zavarzinella formosa]|uniref:APC family permease n=1 Tax=Zavarzinella formosa TaxID=360055 RepID=UPI0003041FC8|nr:APC family permease [Zavarzinella formosa]